MSGVSSPGSWGIPLNEVPNHQAPATPAAARVQVAHLKRSLADHDTYEALILRDTTPLTTRVVKRIVAANAPNKTLEFKSQYLSDKFISTEKWDREFEAFKQALDSDAYKDPFTLYVFVQNKDADMAVDELIDHVREERPDIKVVIGRTSSWRGKDNYDNEFIDLNYIPWNLQYEAMALMLVKYNYLVTPQEAYFWMASLQRDEILPVLSHAQSLLKRHGGNIYPEDAELALAEAVHNYRRQRFSDHGEPQIVAIEPEDDRQEVTPSARLRRNALRAAIDDLGSPLDPYGGVALCRVPNAMVNEAAPQVIDACTELPVYCVENIGEMSQDNDVESRLFTLKLGRSLRQQVLQTPCVFYLPVRRYIKSSTYDELCIALHSVDPRIKLVIATDADRALSSVNVEWFDATGLAIEDEVALRDRHLIKQSGLAIDPSRGHQVLKELGAAEAQRAIYQAQIQRARPGFENIGDVSLLESAVRALLEPEDADTDYAEQFLQKPRKQGGVKEDVAGIPPAVFNFINLVKNYEQYKQLVPSAAKTMLLKGPPGTGKTATARALAAETGFPLFAPKSSEMVSKWVGESANAVYKLFRQVNNYAQLHDTTALLFIDELDALLKSRSGGEGGEREYERITNALLECIQGTADGQYDRVAVIGATNLAHQMDAAALDRFAIKAEIGLPEPAQLEQIFRIHLRQVRNEITDDALRAAAQVAYKNHFSGRIVVQTLDRAGNAAAQENVQGKITDAHLLQAVAESAAAVAEGDSESRLMRATDHLVRDIAKGSLEDHVAGTPANVLRFVRAIRAFDKLKQVAPDAQRSLLLVGPPGTGKTSIARGIAAQTGFPMFAPTSQAFVSGYVGESAERLQKFMDQVRAYATAHNTTAIVFLDEIDGLIAARRAGGGESNRLVNAFLQALQGIKRRDDDNVVIIGATNLAEELDPAMVERFATRAEVGLPTQDALKGIFALHLQGRTHNLKPSDIAMLSGYAHQHRLSGRQVVHALDRAADTALEKSDEGADLSLNRTLIRDALEEESKSVSVLDREPPFGLYN